MNDALKPLDDLNRELLEMKEKTKPYKSRSLSREPKKAPTRPSPKKNDSFVDEIKEVDEEIDENIE